MNLRYRIARWHYIRDRDRLAIVIRGGTWMLYRGYKLSHVGPDWIVWRESRRCLYVRVVSIWPTWRAAVDSMIRAAKTKQREASHAR